MQPAAVQEHVADEGEIIERVTDEILEWQRCEIASRDKCELVEEVLELLRPQADLEEEDRAIGGDQTPR